MVCHSQYQVFGIREDTVKLNLIGCLVGAGKPIPHETLRTPGRARPSRRLRSVRPPSRARG